MDRIGEVDRQGTRWRGPSMEDFEGKWLSVSSYPSRVDNLFFA
jgi:hypothetical protein